MSISVALAQLLLDVEHPEINYDKVTRVISECGKKGIQLLVFPELVNSGYVFENFEEAKQNSWKPESEQFKNLLELTREFTMVVVAGLSLFIENELRNCSVIMDSGKLLGIYYKVHLWGNEPDFFVVGDNPPLVVNTSIGRIATMVCYDVEFPEWVRIAMLDGAQILALPTNWPETGVSRGEIPMEAVRVQAAASQNKIAIAACDRAGSERGTDWVSSSVLVDCDGNIVSKAQTQGEEVVIGNIDLPIDDQIGERNFIKADRRTDLYKKYLSF